MSSPRDARFFQGEFDRFCLACFGNISAQQYIDMRRTFFGGAASFMQAAVSYLSPGDQVTEEDMAMIKTLTRELLDFNEAVKRGEK
jgi:hypothetical protein